MRFLMICLGNICRSPLAHGILDDLSNVDIEVDSAGTYGGHEGNPPDPRSIAVAQENGIDISPQRSRKITQTDLDDFEYLFVMDRSNHEDVLSLCTTDTQRNKVQLLLPFGEHPSLIDLPDPYYGDKDHFSLVFNALSQVMPTVLSKMKHT